MAFTLGFRDRVEVEQEMQRPHLQSDRAKAQNPSRVTAR
jgi:hypothetical protein